MPKFRIPSSAASLVAAVLLLGPPALCRDAEESFLKAYYLEHERGNLEAAAELYRAVAEDSSAPKELRKKAETCAAACGEELAASDFASLVPEDTIVYCELNRPGDQLASLLGQLGLLQGSEGAGNVAVSPLLVKGLLGVRGAAVAITQIDPTGGPPNGVAILHPGDMDVVRGLIDTVLPAGGQAVDSIGGHPTWSIKGQVFVTTAQRLLIASPDRSQIEGVIARLAGKSKRSLADNEDLADTMEMRGDDLLFFCVNAEPIMPVVQALIESQVDDDPRIGMLLDFLDIGSTQAIAGRLGVDESGLSLDLGLQLDEDHRNLAFNLLRKPHLTKRSFGLVPRGAAFFLTTTLNEPSDAASGATDARGRPVVTFMDFGRELFGNVVDVAVFGMPSVSKGPWGPLPDVAVALSVNDAARSRAIWNLVLGIAKGAAGSGDPTPSRVRIAGAEVERYDIEGVGLYLYTHEKRMVVSISERAIAAAVAAGRDGGSVLDDELFAGAMRGFGKECVSAWAVSVGRAAQIAKAFVPQREFAQIAPYLPMLKSTVLASAIRHSDTQLGLSARLTGLPKVGGLVSELVAQRLLGQSRGQAREVGFGRRSPTAVSVNAPTLEEQPAAEPTAEIVSVDSQAQFRKAFEQLVSAGELEGAKGLVEAIFEQQADDPLQLNNFAWALLTEERYGQHFGEAALEMSKRSNELTEFGNWFFLDTLGHAYFAAGELEQAIGVQRKAVEVAGDDSRAAQARKALEKFEAARD